RGGDEAADERHEGHDPGRTQTLPRHWFGTARSRFQVRLLPATTPLTASVRASCTVPASERARPPARARASSVDGDRSRRNSGSRAIGKNVCTAVDTGTTTVARSIWKAVMLVTVAAMPSMPA